MKRTQEPSLHWQQSHVVVARGLAADWAQRYLHCTWIPTERQKGTTGGLGGLGGLAAVNSLSRLSRAFAHWANRKDQKALSIL